MSVHVFTKHPPLLALFAPRPAPIWKAPMPHRSMPKLTGIAQFVSSFVPNDELPPIIKIEIPHERKIRIKKEKRDVHKQILAERLKTWDPHSNKNATKDPFKTLFVARLAYSLTEEELKHEFNRYGPIKDVKLVVDKNGKSRGYAFIEFESSNDLKEAFQHADGLKLKGRRIMVDVERGRTVSTWKPRKLGGGLGKTRSGIAKSKNKSSNAASAVDTKSSEYRRRKSSAGRDKYRERRDKYRDRDFRDRRRETDKSSRDETHKNRSRSRGHKREHGGSKTDHHTREKDRERGRERDSRHRSNKDKNKERNHRERGSGREKRDREWDRHRKERDRRSDRRRSRSKERRRH